MLSEALDTSATCPSICVSFPLPDASESACHGCGSIPYELGYPDPMPPARPPDENADESTALGAKLFEAIATGNCRIK